MLTVKKPTLAHARTALFLSQRALAARAGVGQVTIVRCESGGAIQLLTAQKILAALNSVRRERDQEPLHVEDLDWGLTQ